MPGIQYCWPVPFFRLCRVLPCRQVREVELGMDMPSVLRLLDFLEALFNGGSDFNEPLRRCLNRLTDAKWANSDILLVSGAA